MTTSGETLRDRQIALEQESISLGIDRYHEQRDVEADSLPGRRLLKKAIEPTAMLIVAFVERAGDGKAGRKHAALPYVAKLDPDQAAYLTARCAINGASAQKSMQHVALNIANAVQDHLNLVRLAKEHPGLYRKVSEQLKTSTSARHRSAVYERVITKFATKDVSWDQKEKVLLGSKLLELFIEATDIVQLVRVTKGAKDTPIEVQFTAEWQEVLTKSHEQCALLSPIHLPMIHAPRDWKHPYAGGYLTDALRPRLVRTRSREYLDELGSLDLTNVLKAVNLVQSTPWQINGKVLAVVKELWDNQIDSKALPSRHDVEMPMRPAGLPERGSDVKLTIDQEEALKEWKRKAAKVHEENASMASERVQLAQKLYVADRFKDEAAIYFPHYLDFRGRVYPFANYLNPQGDDVAKGLLQFSAGKPLGATGGFWLAVHIANLFGVDKVPFDERVDWVMANEEKILDSAIDPIDGEGFWQDADSPLCALAACMEWVGFKVNGEAHVSHLPVAMDGSCSGLQHFSALLRDPVGGAAVNLVPAERPADIYTTVAKRAQALSDASASEYATAWAGKFCRSVAKQPTMTLCYSATKRGMHKQIEAALGKLDVEQRKATGNKDARYLPGDVENYHAAKFAAETVWDALGETVVAARAAMDWLQTAAKVLSKANLPVRWTTPMGLPVMQAYREEVGEVVKVYVDGVRTELTLSVETNEIASRRQASGIAPNFVHSLDSSHLMRTAVLGRLNGIESLAVIHDSFGTHACDTDVLHAVIREAFVEQYTPDVLAGFRDEVVAQLEKAQPELVAEIPALPGFGTLDLQAVKDSDFLFA
jgi:DNA-directed RNA polymerase